LAVSYGSYWLRVRFPAQACSQAFVILSEPFIYAFVFAAYLELKSLQRPAWTPGPAASSGQSPSPAPKDGL
jgi:heme/copper-type cytochrome/quinol oxidase subunit 3